MTRPILVLICLLLTVLLPTVLRGAQQSENVPRVGFVSGAGDASNPGPAVERFRLNLKDFGYVAGKNILVEYRYAEGKRD